MSERFVGVTIAAGLLVCGLLVSGCKEGCDDVVCAPAPPVLSVAVLDTAAVMVQVAGTGADSGIVRDTLVEITRRVGDATVTLHSISGGMLTSLVDTVGFSPGDSLYLKTEAAGIPSGSLAVVARRGNRADTITNLQLDQVEGCCGYPVVGNVTVRLRRQ